MNLEHPSTPDPEHTTQPTTVVLSSAPALPATSAPDPAKLKLGARLRRRWPLFTGIAAAVIVLSLVAGVSLWHGRQSEAQDSTKTLRTAKVERTSLVAGFVLSGNLGYGTTSSLGGGGGVITKVPQAGQTVSAGQVVMEIEGAPVFLLQADLPLWRDIAPGVTGVDVAMLRAALAKLDIPVGDVAAQTYDQALSDAIGQLYAKAGYEHPPLSVEQRESQEAAKTSLTTAKKALAQAQTMLDQKKNQRPGKAETIAADAKVNRAQAALDAVVTGQCASPQGETIPCSPGDVTAARDELNLAKAERDDLNKEPDTTSENASVADAQTAVDEAQTAYDKTLGNMVGPKSVVLVPEPQIRVSNVTAKLGLPATGEVLTWTRTLLYGHVDLSSAQRQLLTTGAKAVMSMPDGTKVEGTLGELTDAKTDPTSGQTTPAGARIDIPDQATVADIGPNAISVTFIQETAEDTLVVPVTALMALAEGGYCVELPDHSLVPVDVGLVADTRVQVFTDQLQVGDEVIIP
ncbi:MAG: hypothetical protein LBV06_02365 [Propionibacteriaceae bacterium]|nr:hypothetical protein [Propionibacteriaceae bacterium]